MRNTINRIDETMRLVEKDQLRELAESMIGQYSGRLEFDMNRIRKQLDSPIGNVEREPQISIEVETGHGEHIILSWTDFKSCHPMKDRDGQMVLELVFTEWNLFVYGRDLRFLIPFIAEHATDLAEAVDEDDENELFYIERVLLEKGKGQRMTRTYVVPQTEFLRWMNGIELCDDVLESRAAFEPFKQRSLMGEEIEVTLEDFGLGGEEEGEEEMSGHPRSVEEMRRATQHRNRVKEFKAAKRENRAIDKTKIQK